MKSEKQRIKIGKVQLAEQLQDRDTSLLKRYKMKVYGEGAFLKFVQFEVTTLLFGNVSGGLGYTFRKIFFPKFLKASGGGTILGKGIVIRHPEKIVFGSRVAIDDYVLLDASGTSGEGITIGDDVIISRNCVIQGKPGRVSIGARADIGCNCVISSVSGISIGQANLIAGNCYIGGGRYYSDRTGVPMIDQGVYSEGPVTLGDDVWLGAGAVILDGVNIGTGSIIGAGAVVTKDIPEYSIATGVPARVIGNRGSKNQ